MALKAGYKGIKGNLLRKIMDEFHKIDGIIPSSASADNPIATKNDVLTSVSLLDDTVGFVGKNKFKVTATNHTKNDVVFTVNGGIIELSGTSTGDINVGDDNGTLGTIRGLAVGKKYILSGCPEGGGVDTYRLVIRNDTTTSEYYVDTGNGIEFTAKDVTYTVYIRANSGVNLTDKVFKPMICDIDVFHLSPTYEPFHESVVEMIEDIPSGWDYSTTEVDTGKKWIDGRSIYCRTFDVSTEGTELEVGNSQWVNSGISSTGIDAIVDTMCFNDSGSCYFLMAALTAHTGNVSLLACRAGTGSALAHYVTLFYLKPATTTRTRKSTKKKDNSNGRIILVN